MGHDRHHRRRAAAAVVVASFFDQLQGQEGESQGQEDQVGDQEEASKAVFKKSSLSSGSSSSVKSKILIKRTKK